MLPEFRRGGFQQGELGEEDGDGKY
jgi:hypothetical protein